MNRCSCVFSLQARGKDLPHMRGNVCLFNIVGVAHQEKESGVGEGGGRGGGEWAFMPVCQAFSASLQGKNHRNIFWHKRSQYEREVEMSWFLSSPELVILFPDKWFNSCFNKQYSATTLAWDVLCSRFSLHIKISTCHLLHLISGSYWWYLP